MVHLMSDQCLVTSFNRSNSKIQWLIWNRLTAKAYYFVISFYYAGLFSKC